MIALLSYSTSYCKSDDEYGISSTGEVEQTHDSVFVSIEDLKTVNSKLIELKYEKEINKNLEDIVRNDSVVIESMKINQNNLINTYNKEIKNIKKQRNIYGIISIGLAVLLGISIIK